MKTSQQRHKEVHYLCDVAHKVQFVLLHAQCGDDVRNVGQGQRGSKLYSSAVAPTSKPDFTSSPTHASVKCTIDTLQYYKINTQSHLGISYLLDDTAQQFENCCAMLCVAFSYCPRTIYYHRLALSMGVHRTIALT